MLVTCKLFMFCMLKLESGNYLCFQVDTGAQCNVISLSLYKKARTDCNLVHVIPAVTTTTAYGRKTLPVIGKVSVCGRRGELRCKLDCELVDATNIQP